ncbi:MAG: hypothetical protein AAFO15_01005 [Pseudomonadota bacterium]
MTNENNTTSKDLKQVEKDIYNYDLEKITSMNCTRGGKIQSKSGTKRYKINRHIKCFRQMGLIASRKSPRTNNSAQQPKKS